MREENECEGMKTIKQKKVMSRVLYIVSICLIVGLIVEGCSQKKAGEEQDPETEMETEIERLDSFPVLSISLENDYQLEDVKRGEYTTATASVWDSEITSFTDVSLEIKGRGNTSWLYDKKSYKLKFAEKQNLFGMMDEGQSSKHWILAANYGDETLSKNNLAYTLAGQVFDQIRFNSGDRKSTRLNSSH